MSPREAWGGSQRQDNGDGLRNRGCYAQAGPRYRPCKKKCKKVRFLTEAYQSSEAIKRKKRGKPKMRHIPGKKGRKRSWRRRRTTEPGRQQVKVAFRQKGQEQGLGGSEDGLFTR